MTEKGRGYMPQPMRLDWGTPRYIFRYAEKRWGTHHIDLAASKENTKCDLYIDEEENALDKDWKRPHSRGWLNPPYGKCSNHLQNKLVINLLRKTSRP